MHFWDPAGTLLHAQPFTIVPRGVFQLSAVGVPVLQGRSGSITVSSDARYWRAGGQGRVAEPATGFSFDSPMLARPR